MTNEIVIETPESKEWERRRKLVQAEIEKMHLSGRKPNSTDIHKSLKAQGIDCHYNSVNNDFNKIRDESNFITRLTTNNLSAEIEDIDRTLEFVSHKIIGILDGNLDTVKIVKKELPDGKFVTETTTVPNDVRARISCLKLLADTAKQREALILGQTLDVSAALVTVLWKKQKVEVRDLKARLNKYEGNDAKRLE